MNCRLKCLVAILCASTSTVYASLSRADSPTADSGGLDAIIVTGSRQAGLNAADSPAPIQILSAEALKNASGSPDLMSTLTQLVPSLTMQAFGLDLANQTLEAKLRGVSPNDVLVLVNGKRRHTTAKLAVDSGSVYQGGAGVDLNFIPLDAIDHIEVLTEGASAQYGTDAIAGVVNIILKKNNSGGVVGGTYGNYMNGGGNTGDVSGNVGLDPGQGGFLSLTGETHNHGHSNQSAIDERLINPANLSTYPDSNVTAVNGYPYLNQLEGDAEYHSKLAMFNSGFDFDDGTEVYGFGSYASKTAALFNLYRMPNAAQYTNSAGATTYPLPFGFNPYESTDEGDYSLTAGIKGSSTGWNWDFSTTYGGDKVNIYTKDTYNTGYYSATGLASPTDFYDGSLRTTQWTTNADVNKDFAVGFAGPLNVAFGLEYRRETYETDSGIPLSYLYGGASSFPGYSPTDASIDSRKNEAGYIDLATTPIDALRLDAAGRFEHYSDFGDAKVGKLTSRYDFNSSYAVRATVSNGFRAPTLAEEYYSATNVGPTTAFVQLPPNSVGGRMLGLGNGLQPEHSINYSVGFVWRPIPHMSATLDLYRINITNRIVGTGEIVGSSGGAVISPAVNAAIAANGNQLDPAVVATGTTGIQIFTNGIDTSTQGADLVLNFPVQSTAFGDFNYSLSATFNKTTVTKLPIGPPSLAGQRLYDPQAVSDLTTASPLYSINLGALWTHKDLAVNLREIIWGPSSEYGNDDFDNPTGVNEYFLSRIGITPITNLDISYLFHDHLKLAIGALNLFDRFPGKLNAEQLAHENNFSYGDNIGVIQYPVFSPFGINGGFWYLKATYTF